jgi:hypothetical protein
MRAIIKIKSAIVAVLILISFALTMEAKYQRREDRAVTFDKVQKLADPFAKTEGGSNEDGDLRIAPPGDPGNGPSADELPVPIGDAGIVVLALELAYGIYIFSRKK